jgi:hypothetical protein
MSLSPEVQAQADEIRRNKSLVKSLQAERDLWKNKANESAAALAAMSHKDEMSEEDRAELKRQRDELDALNDELEGAAQENTRPEPIGAQAGSQPEQPAKVEAEPIPTDPEAPRPDPLPGTARGDGVPLMPNMAFDPDPTGSKGKGDAGQPNQAPAIETAGGFLVSGGGTTQRAPGSSPESPSSSQVVPMDPDAKAPANNADVVKSGLGDSSQNATLGNDGQPVSAGPGVPHEPTDAEREAAQKRLDAENEEMARRQANPLNLADPGTPQAGSPEAEKAAREAAMEAQRKAQDAAKQQSEEEKARNSEQKGVADDGSGKPASDFPDERPANPS